MAARRAGLVCVGIGVQGKGLATVGRGLLGVQEALGDQILIHKHLANNY